MATVAFSEPFRCDYWEGAVPHHVLAAGFWSGLETGQGSLPTVLSMPSTSLQRLTRNETFWRFRLPYLITVGEREMGVSTGESSSNVDRNKPSMAHQYDPVRDEKDLKTIAKLVREEIKLESLCQVSCTVEKRSDSSRVPECRFVDLCAFVYGEDSETFYRILAWLVRNVEMDPGETDSFGVTVFDRLSRFWMSSGSRPSARICSRLFEACVFDVLNTHTARLTTLCSLVADKTEDLRERYRALRVRDSSEQASRSAKEASLLEEEANLYRRIVLRVATHMNETTAKLDHGNHDVYKMALARFADVLKHLSGVCDQIYPTRYEKTTEYTRERPRFPFDVFSTLFSMNKYESSALAESSSDWLSASLSRSVLKYFADMRCDNWSPALESLKEQFIESLGKETHVVLWQRLHKSCAAVVGALKRKLSFHAYVVPRPTKSLCTPDVDTELALKAADDFMWFASCFVSKIMPDASEASLAFSRRCVYSLVALVSLFDAGLDREYVAFQKLTKPLFGSSLVASAARWELSVDVSRVVPVGGRIVCWGDFLNLCARYENWDWTLDLEKCSDDPGSERIASLCRKGKSGGFDEASDPRKRKTSHSPMGDAYSLPSEAGAKDAVRLASRKMFDLVFPPKADPNFDRIVASRAIGGVASVMLGLSISLLGKLMRTIGSSAGRAMNSAFEHSGSKDLFFARKINARFVVGMRSSEEGIIDADEAARPYLVYPDVRMASNQATKPYVPAAMDESILARPVARMADVLGERLPAFLSYSNDAFFDRYGDALIEHNLNPNNKKKVYEGKAGSSLETALKTLLNASKRRRTKCSLIKNRIDTATPPLMAAVVTAVEALCDGASVLSARSFLRNNAEDLREAYRHERMHEGYDTPDPAHSLNAHMGKVNPRTVDAAAKILFLMLTHKDVAGSLPLAESATDDDLNELSKGKSSIASPSYGALKNTFGDLSLSLPDYFKEGVSDESYDEFDRPESTGSDERKRRRHPIEEEETLAKKGFDFGCERPSLKWPRDWRRMHKMDAVFRAMTNGLSGSISGTSEDVCQAGNDVEPGEGRESYERTAWWRLASRKKVVRLLFLSRCLARCTDREREAVDAAFDAAFLSNETFKKGTFGFCARLSIVCALYAGLRDSRCAKDVYSASLCPLDEDGLLYKHVSKTANVAVASNPSGRNPSLAAHDSVAKVEQRPLSVRWSFWTCVLDAYNDLADAFDSSMVVYGDEAFFEYAEDLVDQTKDRPGPSPFALTKTEASFLVYPAGRAFEVAKSMPQDLMDEGDDETSLFLHRRDLSSEEPREEEFGEEDREAQTEEVANFRTFALDALESAASSIDRKKKFGRFNPTGTTLGSTFMLKRLYRYKPRAFDTCRPVDDTDISMGDHMLNTTSPLPLGYWGRMFRFDKMKFFRRLALKVQPRIVDDPLSLSFWIAHAACYDPYYLLRQIDKPETMTSDVPEEAHEESAEAARTVPFVISMMFGGGGVEREEESDDDSSLDMDIDLEDEEEDEEPVTEAEAPIAETNEVLEEVPYSDDEDDDSIETDESDEDDPDVLVTEEASAAQEEPIETPEFVLKSEEDQADKRRKELRRRQFDKIKSFVTVFVSHLAKEVLNVHKEFQSVKNSLKAFEPLAVNPFANVSRSSSLAEVVSILLPTKSESRSIGWIASVPALYLLHLWSYSASASLDGFERDSSRFAKFFESAERALNVSEPNTRRGLMREASSILGPDSGGTESERLVAWSIEACAGRFRALVPFLKHAHDVKPEASYLDEFCAFCKESVEDDHAASLYSCGHVVHARCWVKNIIVKFEKDPKTKFEAFECSYRDGHHVEPSRAICQL